jgi:hypothetical protein
MKKICLAIQITAFLLICLYGLQAQTTQTKLNQVELMKQFLGTWQANDGIDTVEVWEFQQFGKAFILNVNRLVKGQKTPLNINSIVFNSELGKFKSFQLSTEGTYNTWLGLFTTEKKFNGDMVNNSNPEIVWGKIQNVFDNPKEFTFTFSNTDGVIGEELKFMKVK